MQVSLIIPVYNARATVRPLFERIARQAQLTALDVEIIFVDDASTDGSLEILRDIEKASSKIFVVANRINQGQSRSTLTGIDKASNDVVVTLDDDLQHQPEDIPRLLAALREAGPGSLAMGHFTGKRRTLWRELLGVGANAISNLFLDKPLPLRLTAFCAFHRNLCRGVGRDGTAGVALITELVQAADRTVKVRLSPDPDARHSGRYSMAGLFRLFMSRSSCYRLSRVLFWLALCSLSTMTATWLLLRPETDQSLTLDAVWLVSVLASSMLAGLVIRMRRQAAGAHRSQNSVDRYIP